MEHSNTNFVVNLISKQKIRVSNKKLPKILPKHFVRIKIMYCGICGTDISLFNNKLKIHFPMSLGHEYCGIVIDKDPCLKNFEINDFVAIDTNYKCYNCYYCNLGYINFCESSDKNLFSNRGFSKITDIHYNYLIRLPNYKWPFIGALAEPLSCILHAVDLSLVKISNNILILGCGGIGMLLAIFLKNTYSEKKIYCYDNNMKRLISLTKYCDEIIPVFNLLSTDVVKYDLIFETTGDPELLKLCPIISEKKSQIVVISKYYGIQVNNFDFFQFSEKEINIKFSHLNGKNDMKRAVKFLQKHWIIKYNNLIQISHLDNLYFLLKNYQERERNKIIIQIS